MGIIMTVVAVLETKAERAAVATMNPKISRPGEKPTALTMFMAIRRWRFQRCIARAMMKPPMNRKIRWLA